MGNEGKENSPLEVIQLAEDTRQAYLFIQNEQQAIYELNNKVSLFRIVNIVSKH